MVFDGTPGAVGALLFAKLLCSAVYAQHAGEDGSCHGIECFRLSHEVVAGPPPTQLVAAVITVGAVLSHCGSASHTSLRIRLCGDRAGDFDKGGKWVLYVKRGKRVARKRGDKGSPCSAFREIVTKWPVPVQLQRRTAC